MKAVTPVPPAKSTASAVRVDDELAVGQLDPDAAPDGQLLLHAPREGALDGVGDRQPIALQRRAGDGEHARVGPEAARLVLVERQVQELARLEARQPAPRPQLRRCRRARRGLQRGDLAVDAANDGHRRLLAVRRPVAGGSAAVGTALAGHEAGEDVDHVVQARLVDARVDADEEGAVHDRVGVGQLAGHPAGDVLEGRVAQQVAAEQVARLDAVGLQEARSARCG